MNKAIIVLTLISLNISSAFAQSEKCNFRDYVYKSGVYTLKFLQVDELVTEEEKAAWSFPFKITNTENDLVFSGILRYGNGYSSPQVGIDVCPNQPADYKEEYKKSCTYSGTVYEIDDLNTKLGFSTESQNPILFPLLNKEFYYSRNLFSEKDGIIKIPGDIWINKGCNKPPN